MATSSLCWQPSYRAGGTRFTPRTFVASLREGSRTAVHRAASQPIGNLNNHIDPHNLAPAGTARTSCAWKQSIAVRRTFIVPFCFVRTSQGLKAGDHSGPRLHGWEPRVVTNLSCACKKALPVAICDMSFRAACSLFVLTLPVSTAAQDVPG
ncbi:hypothetical protein BV20DRAFT_448449 [Pilatotrama ljubarskyi]|nr:hypothetical protein BV20DRAFT_448449 [Pilatotrama ljubarskyi]